MFGNDGLFRYKMETLDVVVIIQNIRVQRYYELFFGSRFREKRKAHFSHLRWMLFCNEGELKITHAYDTIAIVVCRK